MSNNSHSLYLKAWPMCTSVAQAWETLLAQPLADLSRHCVLCAVLCCAVLC
jgi:hypothetical protein